ncbi:MAG: PD40 domain-containing protein [Bacteroidales bacterium]|nr:PD40 domain-containing protein [Bacteroidales bacterium]HQP03871.1 OmpA family protein [Bacteroidales bacterium]
MILIIWIILSSLSSNAQVADSYCNEIDNPKAVKYFETGVKQLNSGKLDNAIESFMKAIDEEENFTEAWVALSEIYSYRLSNSMDSKNDKMYSTLLKKCILKIAETCPAYDNYSVNYSLGIIFFNDDDYVQAKKFLNIYVKNTEKNTEKYNEAISKLNYINTYMALIGSPVPFEPRLLGGVCSADDDYLPLISPDGTMAFYTRAYMKKDLNSIYGDQYTEEFTMSQKLSEIDENLVFSRGKAMGNPFNMGKNQGAVSISIDNSILYITICEFVSRDYDNCDIYYSQRSGESWSQLKNLGPNINSPDTWESQPSISSDGNTLYFSSIRKSNIGFNPDNPTCDIYYSFKDANGVWSKAQNMGPVINTKGNEKSPFIHSDSQTLYFSSDGHPGVGGYDIFYSKYRDGAWNKPQNIGYPINTNDNDLGFIVSTDGSRAFFSSNKLTGMGGWDIYVIDLYEGARPEKVMFVKGKLIDEQGNAITDASIEVENVKTKEVTQGMVDAETGHYAVAVAVQEEEKNDDFLMLVKKDGYSFASHYIQEEEDTEDIFEEIQVVDFEVKPIEIGVAVKINDINFSFASAELSDESLIVLDHFIDFLNTNPGVKFEIRGHTDDVGENITNERLSQARAKSVYQYLLNHGIASSRMTYKGYGEALPLVPNISEANRAINRRTEFYIIEK